MSQHVVRDGNTGRFAKVDSAAGQAFKKALPTNDIVGADSFSNFEEIGATGLKQHSGYIDEEFLSALRGDIGKKTFIEMRDNDATVGAMLFAVKMLIRQVSWNVEAGGDTPQDLEAAEFLETNMGDMSETWSDTIDSVLSFLVFGHSLHEEVYKVRRGATVDPTTNSQFDDGRVGWRKLPIRAQETIQRWQFDNEHGELQGAWQVALPNWRERFLPCNRTLLFRTESTKGNPEGRSILRNAYLSWYFLNRIQVYEGIGVERDLAGLPIVWVPTNYLDTNSTDPAVTAMADQMKKLVTQIKRDEKEGVMFPLAYDDKGNKLFDLTLLSTGGNRNFNTGEIILRYQKSMAGSIMADFLMLGQSAVGSFALASSKTNLFGVAVSSWIDAIANVFNRFAVPRLFDMNSFRLEKLPQLVHGEVETIDLGELGDYISKMAGAGAPLFPDNELENVLRLAAGLPPISEERIEADRQREQERDENRRKMEIALAGGNPDDDDDENTDHDSDHDDDEEGE